MPNFNIAVIPGDGVGLEVTPAARKVLDHAAAKFGASFAWTVYDWGGEYYFHHGRMMPADAIEMLRPADAILLGAVGHPQIPDHVTLNGLLLPIRRSFDQYANVRPALLYQGVTSPLAGYRGGEIDMVARTPKASMPKWAGSSISISRTRSRSRPPFSPAAASSGSCATPSNWPGNGGSA